MVTSLVVTLALISTPMTGSLGHKCGPGFPCTFAGMIRMLIKCSRVAPVLSYGCFLSLVDTSQVQK